MRLRGSLLLALAAGVVAALTLAGPAAAVPPTNIMCGETLHSSIVVTGNLDCSATAAIAIYVDSPSITVNLNGHYIIGAPGFDVVENSSPSGYGLTLENGTLFVEGAGTGLDNDAGASNVTLTNVSISGDKTSTSSYGISADSGIDRNLTMTGGTISGVYYGAYLYGNFNPMFKGVTFKVWDGGYGVYSDDDVTGMSIIGSTFTGQYSTTVALEPIGYGYYAEYDAGTMVEGNTFTILEYGIYDSEYSAGMTISGNVIGGATGLLGNQYGMYFDDEGSGNVISNNYVRNSEYEGITDYYANNNVYTGNVLSGNGNNAALDLGAISGDDGFYIYPEEYGPVTMVNNYSRSSGGNGFYLYEPFNYEGSVPTPPYTMFMGNSATNNLDEGFDIEYPDGATITHNTAYMNGGDGFYFYEPSQAVIDNNSSTSNTDEGFYFSENYGPYAPLSFASNSATYNGDYGFFTDDYPLTGSGNTGGDTNGQTTGVGDCYLVAGCS